MKTVVILIGPKGAGKTTIGKLLAEKIKARFLDVEMLLMEYCSKHSVEPSEIPRHGYEIEYEEISKILSTEKMVIVESTGSSEFLVEYIKSIKLNYNLVPIKLESSYEVCLNRIRLRGNETNFEVSEKVIKNIYTKTANFNMNWAAIINTETDYDISEIGDKIAQLV